jgi:hypothetical protein
MMVAGSTHETSVIFYQTARRNIPEDSRLHTRRRENLKSHSETRMINKLLKKNCSVKIVCRTKHNRIR